MLHKALRDAATDAYVFRPCVVAGPEAPALLDQLPYLRLEHKVPAAALRLFRRLPAVKPVLPDHGVPFQLVHHDDVVAALVAGVLARGRRASITSRGPARSAPPTSPRSSAGTPSGFPGAQST